MPDSEVVREFYPGMGQAVAERTILRKKKDGSWETWGDVAERVAYGNANLHPGIYDEEYHLMRKHLRKASLLMSGRHLQHGDETQPERPLEVFTNCSTAATSFLLFLLLLSGSGVGRCYDDDIILVDWDNAPNLRCVISEHHPDYDRSAHETVRDALHKYGPDSKKVTWFKVPDSREGWAQAVEVWENMAFEKIHHDSMLILDFSEVRAKGSLIRGMQDRPASGPVPLMNAFLKASSLKGSGLKPWKQAMYVDHYFAECVLVGGARRAARMSTKFWKDHDILDFIQVKRPIEFEGKTMDDVIAYRKQNPDTYGFLWSSNNSVMVDEEFWRLVNLGRKDKEFSSPLAKHARKVWNQISRCAYADGTGEPGVINVDKLVRNDEGMGEIAKKSWVGSKRYQPMDDSAVYLAKLAKVARKKKYIMITNPCGEIAISLLGAYCVIADVVPYFADSLDEAEEAFRVATRALIRTNQLDCLYSAETKRTNRIGVGMTGVHEFAWKFFRVGFRDLINPDFETYITLPGTVYMEKIDQAPARVRAAHFWFTLQRFNAAVKDEAEKFSKELGVAVPHTMTTVKPSGTVSKLFGLTEGWHLPSMAYYLRWVQFREDDPLVNGYGHMGYPIRSLKTYERTAIVGFPTAPLIATLGMGNQLVTASEATPEEQYRWLELGEKFWIRGEGEDRGNQISYTLKYDPKKVDFQHFSVIFKEKQRQVRACTVMPQEDAASYEYQPEEPISREEFDRLTTLVVKVAEQIDRVHVDCESGACPIDFKERTAA